VTTKVLYVYGGPEFHQTEVCGRILERVLRADGRFAVDRTTDLDAFARLPGSEYATVVVFTTRFADDLTAAREQGLLDFVRGGGGFVAVHSAIGSFGNSEAYVRLLNGKFRMHPDEYDIPVKIVEKQHYLTIRMPDFVVRDELYHLSDFDPSRCTVLAASQWQGQEIPLVTVRQEGSGRVVYLANGHSPQVWEHPEFQKLLVRAIAWSSGSQLPQRTVRCGLLGYGPAFNMGRGHAEWINATPGMQVVAMCDSDPARVAAAREELPGLEGYFARLDDMLAMDGLDLVVNILPHNLHAPMTLACLQAGKHVVVEKPFSITLAEADAMIEAARAKGLMLSLFHNRRWDGDYLTIRDVIRRGLIGDVFHIECGQGSYGHPGFWWRSDKAVSGGVLHDWGAHFIDWMLNLVDGRIVQVMGDFQKRVWHSVTNEDHGQVVMRFDNGVVADYWTSSIAAITRPKWLILGTLGAIRADWGDEISVVSYASGLRLESKVKVTLPGYGCTQYYRNVADHLLMGEELAVKPEQARRVILVIDAAQRSAASGQSVAPAPGYE
jgi:scyllo-inositol 2-dehydrogenase (NADP+)